MTVTDGTVSMRQAFLCSRALTVLTGSLRWALAWLPYSLLPSFFATLAYLPFKFQLSFNLGQSDGSSIQRETI